MGAAAPLIAASVIAAGASVAASQLNKPKLPGAPKPPKEAVKPLQMATTDRKRGAAGDRGGTILTSPLGVPGEAAGTRKSLLGS